MTTAIEIPLSGAITIVAKANIRQGTPSRSAPIVRKADAGTGLTVAAIVAGESVQGNPFWYRFDGTSYVWAGACSVLDQGSAAAASPAAAAPAGVSAAVPFVPSGGLVANVVDIYHGDQVTNFAAARAAGVLGVIHKATTGGTGSDDAYKRRRDAAREAGLLWGAFHWGTAAPARAQVDNFLVRAEPDGDTLVALDFERDVGNQMTLAIARDFLDEVAQRLGRRAVLYSGDTIKGALGDRVDPFFAEHRLWLAQYGPIAHVQASWSKPWLWQFTSGKANDPRRKTVPGIPGNANGELDCDYYAGTPESLSAEWAS